MNRPNHDIIVMGASFGGIKALSRLVSRLPPDLSAAVFIVQHMSPNVDSILDRILSEKGSLPAVKAEDGRKIESGLVYVAQPNHHLILNEAHMSLSAGPRENRARPSIDVLFRSAAAFHTTRVIGVILTGYLDDGVNGLHAVKRCGGIAVAQDPAEAEAHEMPENAIRDVQVDHILPLDQMASMLPILSGRPAGEPLPVPEDIMEEIRISEQAVPNLDNMEKQGQKTSFTCPECGGVLWKVDEEPVPRFRCHTGHAFTLRTYMEGQAEALENSLWGAARFMRARVKRLKTMARKEREKSRFKSAESYEKTMAELSNHVQVIRQFIISGVLK